MYEVKFYKGDYLDRQRAANEDSCAAYVEHHFNSVATPTASYSCCVTGANASPTSKNWGRAYAKAVANEFGTTVGGSDGILVGGWNGRGDYNLRYTAMPAILLEPLFVSNPQHAELVRSEDGQSRLARVLADSIERFFPFGGLIGFSVGHKYKDTKPDDRGAAVVGGGTEADYAELVLKKAEKMLVHAPAPSEERSIRIMRGDDVLHQIAVDPDADVVWNGQNGVLRIIEA